MDHARDGLRRRATGSPVCLVSHSPILKVRSGTFRGMRTLSLLLAILVLATACRGADAQSSDLSASAALVDQVQVVPTPPPIPTEVPDEPVTPSFSEAADDDTASPETGTDLDSLVERLTTAYPAVAVAWPGFSPTDHPVVLVERNDADEVVGALTIGFPNPNDLGTAELIADHPATGMIHRVTQLTAAALAKLEPVEAFEFNRMVEGVDSFVMVAGGSDPFFAIGDEQYVATLLHEMFHRYQFEAFVEGSFVDQDIEGYDYSAANLELVLLEETALERALLAEPGSAAQIEATRWLVAMRQARLDRDSRVQLDQSQERYEGTARWLEHVLDISSARATPESFANNVFGRELGPSDGVKEYLGFGRWYASGAALVQLAQMLGIDGVTDQIEAGKDPLSVIADEVAVDSTDVDDLVAAARQALDPSGELATLAAEFAERVPNEPSVFGDEDGDHEGQDDGNAVESVGPVESDGTAAGGPGADDGGDDEDVITDDMVQCLVDGGLDVSGSEAEIEVDPELAAKCFDE